MAFFCTAAVFFLILLFRSEFVHFDNFSHWGVAAKVVSQKDMFPNMADTNITFTSYPLGSAAFIYYVTEIVGTAPEWLQMWAQAVLMAGMLVSLFAFGGKLECAAMACVGAVMLLCGNTSFVDLLVDTLLPVAAIGAAAFCIYYRKELHQKIWFLIPYAVFLVSIKNSGALFAAIVLAYVLIAIPRTGENCKNWLVAAISPVAAVFFWNRHVEQVFDDGALSKHAMRIDNFQQILSEKRLEDLFAIIEAFWKQTVQGAASVLWLLLLGLILLLYRRCILKQNCRELSATLIFAGISYLLYQAGTLGMYLLTMPIGEALSMAGYGRYHQTIIIFAAGIILFAAIREVRDSGGGVFSRACGVFLAAGAILLTMTAVEPNFKYYVKQNLEDTERAKFDRLIGDYGVWPDGSYLILVSEERQDYGYLYYMAQYLLSPEHVAVESAQSVKELTDAEFSFVIMFEDTEENKQYLLEQFGIEEEVGYIGGKAVN